MDLSEAIHIETQVGHRLLWHQAEWRNSLERAEHVFGTIHVIGTLPGELAPTRLMSISKKILGSGALMPACAALEYRYVLSPDRSGSLQVDLYFTAKGYSDNDGERAVIGALISLYRSLGPEFELRPLDYSVRDDAPTHGMPIRELRRSEDIITPVYAYVPSDFFYMIEGDLGDCSGWANFWWGLQELTDPVELSFLFKQTVLSNDERSICERIIADLHRYSESRMEYDAFQNLVPYPADTNARIAYESWNDWRRALQSHDSLLVRVALRGPASLIGPLSVQLGAALNDSQSKGRGSQGLEVIVPESESQRRSASESFDWLEVYPWGGHTIWSPDWAHMAPHGLRRLPYLYSLDDASAMAMLPTGV